MHQGQLQPLDRLCQGMWLNGQRYTSFNVSFCSFRVSSYSSQHPPSEEDYEFVDPPPADFYCPVTKDLLLCPQLTSCCGQHLSPEANNWLQREKKPCPLCKRQEWSTTLDKKFQRKVKSLHVFCRHRSKECGWKGELSALDYHDRKVHPHL